MTIRRNTFFAVALVCLGLVFTGCAKEYVPLQGVTNSSVSAYGIDSEDELADVIIRAGNRARWQMHEEEAGRIIAVRHNKAYSITLEVAFTDSEYTITYQDSSGLEDEDERSVNRIANKFILNLDSQINKEMRSTR